MVLKSSHKKIITLGLIQTQVGPDVAKNLTHTTGLIIKAAKQGAQIVCLPELFLSPYFCQGPKNKQFFNLAETIPGPTTEVLGKIAKQYRLVIICSLYEKTQKKEYYNSVAVIGTQGEIIGTYRKMHIPTLPVGYYSENYYFKKGQEGFKIFKTPYGTIGTLICYDQWFPEGARILATQGAQIIFYPTAIGWPTDNPKWKKQAEHQAWQITQRSHGIDNNIFIASVNRIGREKDIRFWGSSFVSDPFGRIICQAPVDKEELLIADIDYSVTDNMREEWPFLQERRIKTENAQTT